MRADDLFEQITNQLIDQIEAGAGEWNMPWRTLAATGTPTSVDGRPQLLDGLLLRTHIGRVWGVVA